MPAESAIPLRFLSFAGHPGAGMDADAEPRFRVSFVAPDVSLSGRAQGTGRVGFGSNRPRSRCSRRPRLLSRSPSSSSESRIGGLPAETTPSRPRRQAPTTNCWPSGEGTRACMRASSFPDDPTFWYHRTESHRCVGIRRLPRAFPADTLKDNNRN